MTQNGCDRDLRSRDERRQRDLTLPQAFWANFEPRL